jgi:hypothetical protein
MEEILSCTTLITTYKTTRRHYTEDHNPLFHRGKTITCHIFLQGINISVTASKAKYIYSFNCNLMNSFLQVSVFREYTVGEMTGYQQ